MKHENRAAAVHLTLPQFSNFLSKYWSRKVWSGWGANGREGWSQQAHMQPSSSTLLCILRREQAKYQFGTGTCWLTFQCQHHLQSSNTPAVVSSPLGASYNRQQHFSSASKLLTRLKLTKVQLCCFISCFISKKWKHEVLGNCSFPPFPLQEIHDILCQFI